MPRIVRVFLGDPSQARDMSSLTAVPASRQASPYVLLLANVTDTQGNPIYITGSGVRLVFIFRATLFELGPIDGVLLGFWRGFHTHLEKFT
jgi:hypothetical protein